MTELEVDLMVEVWTNELHDSVHLDSEFTPNQLTHDEDTYDE